MRVLVADDDAVTRQIIERTVRASGHEPVTARDGEEAFQLATGPDAPSLLLLDWMMPKMTGVEVCRRVRALPLAQPHILMLSGRSLQRDLLEAFEAGADDYLLKPCPPAELTAKLRATQRWLLREGGSHDVRDLLRVASQSRGGEVVIKQQALSGRVYFYEGRVVWVHLAPSSDSLLQQIATEQNVSRGELQAALEESRRSGRFFGDIFIEWKLLDEATFRESLRGHFAEKLGRLAELTQPEAIFVPQNREYHGGRGFLPSEVLPPRWQSAQLTEQPPASAPGAPSSGLGVPRPGATWVLPLHAIGGSVSSAEVSSKAEETAPTNVLVPLTTELKSLPGVRCALVHDLNTGEVLSQSGSSPAADVVWAFLLLLRALSGTEDGIDDVMSTSPGGQILARIVPGTRCAVLLVLDKTATLAMLRHGLSRAVASVQNELARLLP